ncbi:Hypothetical predicted protein [Pelobates cultripes]|uniref:Uncharacterized protein n=1 Tax=Pelobates cultripes TaxID=61616 RepID=A0AAD1SW69_PELCU|nr:Hypothetical predicted protein [Pelobates cultripes]
MESPSHQSTPQLVDAGRSSSAASPVKKRRQTPWKALPHRRLRPTVNRHPRVPQSGLGQSPRPSLPWKAITPQVRKLHAERHGDLVVSRKGTWVFGAHDSVSGWRGVDMQNSSPQHYWSYIHIFLQIPCHTGR